MKGTTMDQKHDLYTRHDRKYIAITWFNEADWPRWLAIDPEFQPDYDLWLERMDKMIAALHAQNIGVVKVMVDPDEFVRWAGDDVGSIRRSTFAALKAKGLLKTPQDA